MSNVAVIIATFGDVLWQERAIRAIDSVYDQTVLPWSILHPHCTTLAGARNDGAARTAAEWLIFLDADDELDPHYIEEMLKGDGDIRQPSTLGIVDGVEDDYPVLIPADQSFMVKNHLVIGSMVRRELFQAVNGFRDLPCLEDWDLWIRLRLTGATVGACPNAVYRVHVCENSRNQDVGLHSRTYREIQERYQADWYAKGLK